MFFAGADLLFGSCKKQGAGALKTTMITRKKEKQKPGGSAIYHAYCVANG